MADPLREVIVMVGDGSYLMLNSEIATSVALDLKLTIVVLDNRGFACIDRLQLSVGGGAFNLFNHFNPRDVQNNVSSASFDGFFNSAWREYRGKFVLEF